ncbi:MAG: chemotaxis protein CheW [Chloroflexi bacterium]|nr:chemotaxis protein CheW [Chloroflexota bacterium]
MTQPKNKKPALSPIMRLQLRRMKHNSDSAKKGITDWDAIRAKIAATGQADELKVDTGRVLHNRAVELARPVETVLSGTSTNTLVVLQRGSCQLALDVEYVREIIPLESVTYVPGVPEFIVGVVNARGKILTLVNLEIFLRQGAGSLGLGQADQKQTVVMVETGNFEFGLLCDGFPVIGQHNPTLFKESSHTILDYRTDYLVGMDTNGVLLLNLATLVTDPDFLVDQD